MQCNVLIKIKAAGNDVVSCTGMLEQQDSEGPRMHDRRHIISSPSLWKTVYKARESNHNERSSAASWVSQRIL